MLQGPVEPSQYTSAAFRTFAAANGVLLSVGRTGNCWDNALAESFFASLKLELVHRYIWPTRRRLIGAVVRYIETFYNRRRRHSALGMLSPAAFELAHLTEVRAA